MALIPVHEPGTRVTGKATGTITEGRFVVASADISGGPLGTENPNIAQAGSGAAAWAVACIDGVTGDQVPLIRGFALVPMVAGAAVAIGVGVQSDGSGRPITLASGVKLGVALSVASALGDTILVALQL